MKLALLFISLLVCGCNRRDTQLRDQIAGTWVRDGVYQMRFQTDGSFVSEWTLPAGKVTFQGIWKIQNGGIVSELTNYVAQGPKITQKIGSVGRWTILTLDRTALVWSENGETVSLKRK